MAYSAKNAVAEIALINIIRALYIGVCVSFMFPMFKANVTLLDLSLQEGFTTSTTTHTLTGFQTIFGVADTTVSGNPFALAIFILPIAAIMVTLLNFLYDYLHIVIYIIGGIGIVSSIVYAVVATTSLANTIDFLGITMQEIRGGLSWGIFLLIAIYAATIGIALLYKRATDES
jgi:hypothetical protein